MTELEKTALRDEFNRLANEKIKNYGWGGLARLSRELGCTNMNLLSILNYKSFPSKTLLILLKKI